MIRKTMKWMLMTGYTAMCAMLLFGVNGNAYIDPSVVSYLIQAIAGIVVAVGAVVGLYVRKARKKINEKMGIDENRNKEVETNDIFVTEEDEKKNS